MKTGIICQMMSYFPAPIRFRVALGLALLIGLALPACSRSVGDATPTLPSPTLAPPSSPTPFQPSPTPEPAVAIVNGEAILMADYQAELARYQAAVGTQLATGDQQRVLDSLVDELLLAQAAANEGYVHSEDVLQEHYDRLVTRLGSAQALKDWMAANGYTEESFRLHLARSIAAAWMRDHITGAIPATAEQVHARQILLYNSEEAAAVLAQLASGQDFNTLAVQYDPVSGGDLGWFPSGYLLDPGLDQAAFSLQPGETSPVIQTAAGFHLLQVVEIDPQRLLDPQARQALQLRSLQDWLQNRRSQSQLQVLLP